jgi:4-nitrophenyl phosphatase
VKQTDPSTIKTIILDMDGVLWRDDVQIGDLPAIFAEIDRRCWQLSLATNNATRTIDQYVDKLLKFGVRVHPNQIINSAQAAANYLKQRFPQGGNVYVVGESALSNTLLNHGYTNSTIDALAVVVGMDRQLVYEKLRQATLLLRGGAIFVATNPDRTFPTPAGLVPGTGAILAALEAASEIQPIIVGKPAPEMYQLAMQRMNATPESTLVVGDRLETDIAGAQKIGCRTALVLSGVTSMQKAQDWKPALDWLAPDLSSLIDMLK